MKIIFKYLIPYKKQLIIGPSFKLLEAVLELYVPYRMAKIIDNGVLNGDRKYIIGNGFFLLGVIFCGLLCALVCQYLACKASQAYGTALREGLFEKIIYMPRAQADRFGTATLINRLTGDINVLQLAVAMLIRLVVRAPFLCVGGLVMAFIIDWRFALIVLFTLPVFAAVMTLIMKKSVPLHRSVQEKSDRLSSVLRENLSGVRVIRAFIQTGRQRERFEETAQEYAEQALRVGRISILLNPLTMLVMNLAVVLILYLSGADIKTGGKISPGNIIAFINYVNQILFSLIVVANLVVLYTKAYSSGKRVAEVLDTGGCEPEGAFESGSGQETAVEFKNVSFAYNGENILENISFKIKSGQNVGIIGGTGAGKTTLVNLMLRLYVPSDGAIDIMGRNINDYANSALRSIISAVPQKTEIFSGTVYGNIGFGNAGTNIEKAAEAAQASEFINNRDEKYQAGTERGGMNFSGGQRQRIAVARMLAREPEIMIFDDSFSALDYSTELKIRKALKKEYGGATIFTVSQRISAIKNSDVILVLDDGVLAGAGTHAELIKNCAEYAVICASQEAER